MERRDEGTELRLTGRLAPIARILLATIVVLSPVAAPGGSQFIRGDADGDGTVNIVDPISVLRYLSGTQSIDCLDAIDANDNGVVNLVDAVYMFHYLFLFGDPPMPPWPACGGDPSPDSIDCASFPFCP